MTSKITEITRRDIIDAIFINKIDFYGRLGEIEFLSRIWKLETMPSTDSRYKNAEGDIWQHTVNNDDWDRNWVFSDSRFDLMNNDEMFLKFLCESIHPAIRSDAAECRTICAMYNEYLKNDNVQLWEEKYISGKPIFGIKYINDISPNIRLAKNLLLDNDINGYVSQQIKRMEDAINTDPALAIGTAKELIETCCKSILLEIAEPVSHDDNLQKLVKKTVKFLALTPKDIPEQAKASETIRALLSNLAIIAQGIAELRNEYGTGHGKAKTTKGLQPRHAKLAVGAASTLAIFLTETYNLKNEKANNDKNQ